MQSDHTNKADFTPYIQLDYFNQPWDAVKPRHTDRITKNGFGIGAAVMFQYCPLRYEDAKSLMVSDEAILRELQRRSGRGVSHDFSRIGPNNRFNEGEPTLSGLISNVGPFGDISAVCYGNRIKKILMLRHPPHVQRY